MKKKKEKAVKEKQPSFFGELGCYMKPYGGKYTVSVLLSILSVAAGIGAYAFMGIIASMIFTEAPQTGEMLQLAAGAVICKILHGILLNVSTWISHKAAYFTLRDIRTAVSEKMMRLPMGYFEEKGSGRLKTLMVDNIENMEKTLAHMLPELTADILGPCACMIWMFFIDFRLALCVIIWIILGFSVTGGMMKGYEEKYEGQIRAFKGMNQAVVEFVNGIEVSKTFGRSDECYEKYENAVYNHASYNVEWQKETRGYSALGMAIAPFSIFPVLMAGLVFYGNGTLEAGTLFLVILLTFGIFTPLMNAMNYFDQLASMGTNAKEIKDIIDYPELERGTQGYDEGNSISFEHVEFSYDMEEEKVLKDVSFHIPEGTMFALAGPSGSGKSTIAKLIAGYWDSTGGKIKIGNRELREYSQDELNRKIAFVDQETFLFDKTIMENIRMGNPEATDEEVIEAATKAGCHEFIMNLPDGYNTSAGTAGNRLSGGEKQRVAIARAMMKNAPVLILDEATASSDPENEASIQKALSAAAKEKTLIVIAHRLITIMNADQIAFVKNGEITAKGTHEELLEHCKDYKDMWLAGEEK